MFFSFVEKNLISCVCVQVTRHLLKLFDNIADLRFKDPDSKERGGDSEEAVAIGMYSREGEYVPFAEPCVCKGQVLNVLKCSLKLLLVPLHKSWLLSCTALGEVS